MNINGWTNWNSKYKYREKFISIFNRLKKIRKDRNNAKFERNISALRKAAEGDDNLMPYILDCVHSHATLGETCQVLRDVFGEYVEPAIY